MCWVEVGGGVVGRVKEKGTGIEDILCVFTPEPHYKNQNLHFQLKTGQISLFQGVTNKCSAYVQKDPSA